MATTIPKISVTMNQYETSSSSEDDYDDSSDMNVQMNSDNQTDVEDFDSQIYKNLEEGSRNGKSSKFVENDITDVEYFYSDVEHLEDDKKNIYSDLKLSLQEFLQYGQNENISTNNEMHEKVEIKSGNFLLAQNFNCYNDYLTDCEDYNTDSDIENVCEKSVCLDIGQAMNELANEQIRDNTDMNDIGCSIVQTDVEDDRLSHVTNISDLGEALSDVGDVDGRSVSGDELLEISDEEEDCHVCFDDDSNYEDECGQYNSCHNQIPSIDVTFVPISKRRTSSLLSASASAVSLLQVQDANEETHTDIERLYDSGPDDDDFEKPIPHAIIIASDDEGNCQTDIEYIQVDIEQEEYALEPIMEFPIKNIPLPHREVIKLAENNFGDTITEVTPMDNDFPFGIYYAYNDECTTETEEESGTDECKTWTYNDLSLPALSENFIDQEVITSNEGFKQCTKKRQDIHTNIESITDVEEIYFDGTNRRKKVKARNMTKNQMSKSKYLEIDRAKDNIFDDVPNQLAQGRTSRDNVLKKNSGQNMNDVADISSDDNFNTFYTDESLPVSSSSASGHVEKGDPNNLDTSSNKNRSNVNRRTYLKTKHPNVSELTDVEDVVLLSDDNNTIHHLDDRKDDINELHNLLIDSHTVVREKSRNNFNIDIEKLHIKGISDSRDAHTDTEYVEVEEYIVKNNARN